VTPQYDVHADVHRSVPVCNCVVGVGSDIMLYAPRNSKIGVSDARAGISEATAVLGQRVVHVPLISRDLARP
jgi:hypothetical protein